MAQTPDNNKKFSENFGVLAFPRSKPLGANSENSANAIRKKNAFPTEIVDYLKLEIFTPKKKKSRGAIYLYLPPKLSESYRVKYNGIELGPVGGEMVNAAAKIIDQGGSVDGIESQVKNFAAAAKPALGFKVASGAISGVVGLAGVGQAPTSGQLATLTTKKAFNPYEETIFQGGEFRNHTFDFTLAPKDASEVTEIIKIIQTLRTAMLPAKGSNDSAWLTIPDFFRASIVRYSKKKNGQEIVINKNLGDSGGVLNFLMQFPNDMVLMDMGVDMSPYGNYSSIQSHVSGYEDFDFGPLAYSLKLSFQETKYLTKESFASQV